MAPARLRRRWAAAAAAAALAAAPAAAQTDTLRRAVQNVALAPVDMGLAPWVAARSVWRGLGRSEEPAGLRWGFALPGLAWNTVVQAMAAVVREVAGLLELPAGLALLFSERASTPLFAPAEDGPALVEIEAGALRLRAGIDVTAP